MVSEQPSPSIPSLKFRILKSSSLLPFQEFYSQISIEQLYPELGYAVENRAYLYYLAHWDLALNLTDNASRYVFCQRVAFTRLNELHVLSYLQQPHYRDEPDLLSRLFYKWARDHFNQALAYFKHAVPIRYNLLVVDLILADTGAERAGVLDKMALLLTDVTKYGDSMESYRQFIANTHNRLSNDPRLPQDDFANLTHLSFLGQSMHELAALQLSADERAQAFACRTKLFIGSPSAPNSGLLDYANVTWRTGLLQCLSESESIADHHTVQIGCVGPPDPLFMSEIQPRRWHCIESATPEELPENLDVITLWHMADLTDQKILNAACNKLKPGGLLLAAGLRSQCQPGKVQAAFEAATGSTCYLIDRESFTDLLVAYVIKGDFIVPTLQVLILIPPYSIWTFGGFEWQLFKSRRYFKQQGIRSDISLACRLDASAYDAIYVLGCAHEDYKVRYLQAAKQSKIYMPVPLLFGIEHAMGQRLADQLKERWRQEPHPQLSDWLQQWDFRALRHQVTSEQMGTDPDRAALQKVAQVCDYFIPQSTLELQHMFPDKMYTEIPHQLILNGCEHAIFEQATADLFITTYEPPTNFVLCVGRIDPNKNQLLLCQALRPTDLPLVLIGAIDDPVYFEMCLEASNGQILHLKNISDNMLASALKAAKLFVLPSCTEVFPLATVEAAWAGCPIVMTRCSGQAELFEDAVIYIDPFDITEMRHAILDVYHANNTLSILKAKNKVLQQVPTWQEMGTQIAEVLLRCANGEF